MRGVSVWERSRERTPEGLEGGLQAGAALSGVLGLAEMEDPFREAPTVKCVGTSSRS